MRIFSMLTSTVAFGMALASQAAVSTAASGTSVVIKDDIIFAERVPSQDGHYYAAVGYSCAYPEKKIYGVGPARLNRFNPGTRQVKVLLEDNGGSIRNPRVDYDAKRILFSWRKKGEEYHHLWEIDADGSNLRQITTGPWDDIEPCYLPDGGIVFCSTRAKRYVGCWYVQALTLFRCERNGSNLRMLTSSAFTENSPSVLADGRVIFTRWEYVNRPPTTIHDLWTMNSDGTAQQLFFGGLTPNPLIDAVQIPGEQGVVCIQGGHAGPEHYGHLVKISERGGPNQPQSLTYLSLPAGINGASINPVTPHLAPGETLKKDLSLVKKDGGERFRFPYPVTKSTFLVALHDHLLLYDSVTGAVRKIFYESKTGWSMVDGPCLLRPRPREPVAAGTLDMSQVTGTVFLFDVYVGRNMRGVKPGAIKKLLVLEDLPKPVVFHGGGSTPISHGTSSTLHGILGTVPVEGDGSACFEVPAMRSIYLALLDERDRSVKQMRSFMTLQPGERRGCIGCHEPPVQSPPATATQRIAFARPPSKIEPIKGVPQILDLPRDIQPILNRHCVSCHNPDKFDGGVVLTGNRSPGYSLAYYNLLLFAPLEDQGYRGNNDPYTTYSSGSVKLMEKFGSGHYDAKLSPAEHTLVRLWVDSAVPFAGTYAASASGRIGGIYGENQPVLEMADNWPSTEPAKESYQRRCHSCHGETMPRFVTDQLAQVNLGDLDGYQREMFATSRYRVFDLTQPGKSLFLMAPLARKAGGHAEGTPTPALINKGKIKFGPPPSQQRPLHPVIFEATSDPDYQAILAHIQAAGKRLDEIKRFDMPGFVPHEGYIREMKRYGVLPESFDPAQTPIDVYDTDRRYFELFWHRPQAAPGGALPYLSGAGDPPAAVPRAEKAAGNAAPSKVPQSKGSQPPPAPPVKTAMEWYSECRRQYQADQKEWLKIVSDDKRFQDWWSDKSDEAAYMAKCFVIVYETSGRITLIRTGHPENRQQRIREFFAWIGGKGGEMLDRLMAGQSRPEEEKFRFLLQCVAIWAAEKMRLRDPLMAELQNKAFRVDRLERCVRYARQILPAEKVEAALQKVFYNEPMSEEDIQLIRLETAKGHMTNACRINALHYRGAKWQAPEKFVNGDKVLDFRARRVESAWASSTYTDFYPRTPLHAFEPWSALSGLLFAPYWHRVEQDGNVFAMPRRLPPVAEDGNDYWRLSTALQTKKKPVLLFVSDSCDDADSPCVWPMAEYLYQAYRDVVDFYFFNDTISEAALSGVSYFGPLLDYGCVGTIGDEQNGHPYTDEERARTIKQKYMSYPNVTFPALMEDLGSTVETLSLGPFYVHGGSGGFIMFDVDGRIWRPWTVSAWSWDHDLQLRQTCPPERAIHAILRNGGRFTQETYPFHAYWRGSPAWINRGPMVDPAKEAGEGWDWIEKANEFLHGVVVAVDAPNASFSVRAEKPSNDPGIQEGQIVTFRVWDRATIHRRRTLESLSLGDLKAGDDRVWIRYWIRRPDSKERMAYLIWAWSVSDTA